MPSLQPSEPVEDPRRTLAELATEIHAHFGPRLLGLYLFGSLAAGGFHVGRSDIDLLAVLSDEVADGADLDELSAMHAGFEDERPAWRDRIETLYLTQAVLRTFATEPRGRVARVSPGEPMHQRELDGNMGWILDWHGVVSAGETLYGPPPLELGPPVTTEMFRAAVLGQLAELRQTVRDNTVAYVPVNQGYIVATVCRALYSLATGEQTSKERAVAWLAEQRPDLADYLWSSYATYRADVRGPHERLIQFVDAANKSAGEADGAL